MINFDTLPTSNEFKLEADVYLAHIAPKEQTEDFDTL